MMTLSKASGGRTTLKDIALVLGAYAIGVGAIFLFLLVGASALSVFLYLVEGIGGDGTTALMVQVQEILTHVIVAVSLIGASRLMCDLIPDGDRTIYGWPVVVGLAALTLAMIFDSFDWLYLIAQVGISAATVGVLRARRQ